jgi:hypothetical protein
MEAVDYAARGNVRRLLQVHPSWKRAQLAQATRMSPSWVDKWKQRLKTASPTDERVLHGRSRAPHHPPPRLDPQVVDRVLEIRDEPPEGLGRTPGRHPRSCPIWLAMSTSSRRVCACHVRRAPCTGSCAKLGALCLACRMPQTPSSVPSPWNSGNSTRTRCFQCSSRPGGQTATCVRSPQHHRYWGLRAHCQPHPWRFYGRNCPASSRSNVSKTRAGQ